MSYRCNGVQIPLAPSLRCSRRCRQLVAFAREQRTARALREHYGTQVDCDAFGGSAFRYWLFFFHRSAAVRSPPRKSPFLATM